MKISFQRNPIYTLLGVLREAMTEFLDILGAYQNVCGGDVVPSIPVLARRILPHGERLICSPKPLQVRIQFAEG